MMRRHELDPVSMTFGFAFTGLGLLFLVGRADQALRLQWVWPDRKSTRLNSSHS